MRMTPDTVVAHVSMLVCSLQMHTIVINIAAANATVRIILLTVTMHPNTGVYFQDHFVIPKQSFSTLDYGIVVSHVHNSYPL